MNKKPVTHRAKAIACGLALAACTLGAATPAMADNTGTTQVTVQASNENLAFRVPTIIPFSAAADGVLTGPSPSATQIENLSVFSIHVTNMKVDSVAPWALTSDAATSKSDNSIDFQVGPEGATYDAFAASRGNGTDLSRDRNFNMYYKGNVGSTLPLVTTGDISRSTGDIYHTSSKVGTITWTLEAGLSPQASS